MLLLLICALLSSSLTDADVQRIIFKVPKYNPLPKNLNIQSDKLKLNITLTPNGYNYSIINTVVHGVTSKDKFELGPLHAIGYSHTETGSSLVASEESNCVKLVSLSNKKRRLLFLK